MDAAELKEFRSTIEHLLASTAPGQVVAELVESGWAEIYDSDPGAALGALFEVKGETLATASLYELLAAPLAGLEPGGCRLVLPARSDGAGFAGYSTGPLDADVPVLVVETWDDGGGVLVLDGGTEFPTEFPTELTAEPAAEPAAGLDPDAGWQLVRADALPSGRRLDADTSAAVLDVLRRSLAHELIGQTRQMLRLAIEHVSTREQFGRPLGSFQAVKHRLADVSVLLTGAECVVTSPEREPSADPAARKLTARVALASALSAADLARRNCLQVCGAIGFTWEFELHRYLRRSLVLDALTGSATARLADLGRSLIEAAAVPRIGDVYA